MQEEEEEFNCSLNRLQKSLRYRSTQLDKLNRKLNEDMEYNNAAEKRTRPYNNRKISMKQRIFQEDSLSPLLFCLALVAFTSEINASGYGYKMNKNSVPISNLLYMDDLKLYASAIVKQFSKDIKMNFGLNKCSIASFIKS